MVKKLRNTHYFLIDDLLKVVYLKIVNSAKIFADLTSRAYSVVTKLWRRITVAVLIGMLFLVLTTIGIQAQSSIPEITIEANPFKFRDTAGHSYILIANKDLTEDLTVHYEVVSDSDNPILKMATLKPVPDHANENFTEFRVNVTEPHSEVRLKTREGYTLGNPASAIKIDQPIETTETAPGVQIKFRQSTVNEGSHATLVARLTPYPQNIAFIRLDFLFKIDEGEYIRVAGFSDTSEIDPFVHLGPVTGFNMAFEFNEVGYFFKDTDYDLNDITLSVDIQYQDRFSKRVTGVTRVRENSEATIRVLNDDLEKLVRIETTKEMIDEGEVFPVTITASRPKPNDDIVVEIIHNDFDTGFFKSFEPEGRITLTNEEPSKTIMVNTYDLPGPQGDGVIQVSIVEEPSFTIETGKGQISVNIRDHEAIEVSFISDPPTQNIMEGQVANFTIMSKIPSTIDLNINIYIDNPTSSNFFTWRAPKSVLLKANAMETEFSIMTGTQSDSNGSFSVSIGRGFGYRPIAPLTAVVNVTAVADEVNTDQRISVASVAVDSILSTINPNPPTNQSEITSLPVISVVANLPTVEEGLPVEFTLISQNVVPFQLRIGVSISGTSGLIVSETNRTILLGANQSQTRFSILTIDNDRAEDNNRYVSVSINPNTTYTTSPNSTAVVAITDHVDRERRRNELEVANREVLSELYQNIGFSSWTNLTNQIEFALSRKNEPTVILGGHNTINEFLTANARSLEEETWSWHTILDNSSFAFNLNPDNQGSRLGTVWGLGQQHTFSQNVDNSTDAWNGELLTAQFGSDLQLNNNGIAGLSISVSDSAIEFGNEESTTIHYDLKNNFMQSYLGWQFPSQNTEIRAASGYGVGEIILKQDDYSPLYLNSNTYSIAFGGNILLYSSPMSSNQLTNRISLIGDSFLSQINISDSIKFLHDQQFNFGWTQLGIELSNQYDFVQGKSLQIQSTISGRSDLEDNESKVGFISQSGITYSDQLGVSVSGTGQLLWYQDQHVFDNLGVRGTLNFDSDNDNLGMLVSLVSSWNFEQQDYFSRLIENQPTVQHIDELVHNDSNSSLYSEIGYGIEFAKGWSTITPYSNIELRNSGNQAFHLGGKFKIGHNILLKIENSYNFQPNKHTEDKVKLSGRIQW